MQQNKKNIDLTRYRKRGQATEKSHKSHNVTQNKQETCAPCCANPLMQKVTLESTTTHFNVLCLI